MSGGGGARYQLTRRLALDANIDLIYWFDEKLAGPYLDLAIGAEFTLRE